MCVRVEKEAVEVKDPKWRSVLRVWGRNGLVSEWGKGTMGRLHRLWRWNRLSVPKRQHITFRRQWITQKKEHNTQSTAKVWNKELLYYVYWISLPNLFRRLRATNNFLETRMLGSPAVQYVRHPHRNSYSYEAVVCLPEVALSVNGVHMSISILWTICAYIHISDCVQTAYVNSMCIYTHIWLRTGCTCEQYVNVYTYLTVYRLHMWTIYIYIYIYIHIWLRTDCTCITVVTK
jgi:hypothetical protein